MLQIKSLSDIVDESNDFANLESIEQYRTFVERGVFFIVHPAWNAFANNSERSEHFPNSQSLVEDYTKEILLEIAKPFNTNDFSKIESINQGALYLYSLASSFINEMTFFSALEETKPLVFLALPKHYDRNQLSEYLNKANPWGFADEYVEYLAQATDNQPNFVCFETKDYDYGTTDKATLYNLREIIKYFQIKKSITIGGNINGCYNYFVSSFKSVIKDIHMTSLYELCSWQKDFDLSQTGSPNGEPVDKAYPLLYELRDVIKSRESEIKEFDLEQLQTFIYSHNKLNQMLYPSNKGKFWYEEKGKPDFIMSQKYIHSLPIKAYLNRVSQLQQLSKI